VEDFRPPWPTFPGSGPKPLDGSILLKFLLETRLQSDSFGTLDAECDSLAPLFRRCNVKCAFLWNVTKV